MIDDLADRHTAFDAGLITGVVLGAAIALLYAPMRGETLRRRLDATFRWLRDDVARQYVEIERDLRREFEQVRRAFEQAQTEFRTTTRQLRGSS